MSSEQEITPSPKRLSRREEKARVKKDQRDYFANRYKRLDELQRVHGEHLTKEGVALLKYCKFSTVCDLRDLGVRNVEAFLVQKQTQEQGKK